MLDSTNPIQRVLILVPAFNEAGSIATVVEDIHQHAPNYDILVVDDGSTDATAATVPACAQVLRLPFNLGIGGAMQAGYRYAEHHGYDAAVQCDADGQHPALHLSTLIERLSQGDADLVVGSRFAAGGDGPGYNVPGSRRAGIQVLRHLTNLLTGGSFTDITSGFRAANRRVIHAFAYWYPEDYPEPETILLLSRAGYHVVETPTAMSERRAGTSSISTVKGVAYVIKVAAALMLGTFRVPWPEARVTPPPQSAGQPSETTQ